MQTQPLQDPKRASRGSIQRVVSQYSSSEANLYEATYSGVDVYELVVQGNQLMRRRDDSWVNATHILKVFFLFTKIRSLESKKEGGPAFWIEKYKFLNLKRFKEDMESTRAHGLLFI